MSRRRSKPAVQRYHDRVARRYEASYEDEFWQWHDTLTWEHLKPHLPRDQATPTADLGCGAGKWALRLLQSGYHVTCVDISGAMVSRTRANVEEAGKLERGEFVQADLCDLSALPRDHFGLALAMGDPICCASSPPLALKEIRKTLLPEGVLVASLDNRLAAMDYYIDKGDPAVLADFLKTGRTHWLTADKEERFEIHTYTPDQARKLFETAGFEVLSVIGKTVLPMRYHRQLLTDSAQRRAWLKIEQKLAKDPDAIGRASHIQIAAKRVK